MPNTELPIDLHISRLLNTEKVDIEYWKKDIQSKKVDIESVLSNKGTDFCLKQLFISIVFSQSEELRITEGDKRYGE